ncbi:MAG: hypothetical protein K2N54_08560 [Helicobacter sp.]|nr:hypothetical protein [Helicobacter sp.]MDE7256206.1 hypothetical protein [Helicobacter sp.]
MIDENRKKQVLNALQNTSWGRTVQAPLNLEFALIEAADSESTKAYEREYASLSNADADPLGEYMKYARAKADSREADDIVLKLLVTLHYKLDEIKNILTDNVRQFVKLESKENVEALGHSVIIMPKAVFQKGAQYYARIDLPVFPERLIPIFLEAIEPKVAKVKRIHERDERDWDSYITSRERSLIRELKGF